MNNDNWNENNVSQPGEISDSDILESTLESTLDSGLESTNDLVLESTPDSAADTSLESSLESTNNTVMSIEKNHILKLSKKSNNEDSENDCVICLEGGSVILNPLCDCKFYFHEQCYTSWLLNNHKACILCKKDLSDVIEIELFRKDSDGMITEDYSDLRNQFIQNRIPINLGRVNRQRQSIRYSTNRIVNAEIHVIPNREDIEQDIIIHRTGNSWAKLLTGLTLVGGVIFLVYGLLETF